MQPTIIRLDQDVTLLHIEQERFRSGMLSVLLAVPLRESTAASYAILPGLLSGSCRALPTFTAMNRRLEELYGATVRCHTLRLGAWQVLRLSIDFLREPYTLHHEQLGADATQLLLDMLLDPLLDEDGAFTADAFAREKRCLMERVQAEINSKRVYARHQCEKLLCPNHPYSINPLGTVDTIEALTPASAAEAWRTLLATARIHWINQDVQAPDALTATIKERFAALPARRTAALTADHSYTLKTDKLVETMPVKQAKLVLGLRIAAVEPDDSVQAARLMTALLGGCPSSLLFRHVREELSLCYYCAARYDRLSGILLIDSGVEAASAIRARDEILRQIQAIKDGRFTDEELEDARRSLIQQFAACEETPEDIEAYYASQTLYDRYKTVAETVDALRAVTRDEVQHAARMLHYDATYLLCPEDEEVAL